MTCDPFITRFRCAVTSLLSPGTGLVVAVSGGADSMALLHGLVRSGLVQRHPCVVAHFDHALRDTSADDAHFVTTQAALLHLTTHVERWQEPHAVGNLAQRARQARYAFLARVARHTGATALLTGHQQDDQAETFLERILRGSGVRGLGAMEPIRPLEPGTESDILLVRPLLSFRRERLRQWLQTHDLPWRDDPGNGDRRRLRSRLRHQLLPCLQAVNPDDDPVPRLAATADRMQSADVALEWIWQRVRHDLDIQSPEAGVMTLAHDQLASLPTEIMRRAVVHCHAALTGDPFPPGARAMAGLFRHMQTNRATWNMRMRGMTIQRVDDRLILKKHLPGNLIL
ncbi:MAG: tRNA lysidine(34) synthetase TilS [Magnetococcales bacterium]|nr:tRNA lysidine(34) synthetase TilS [Magnetococcales bacterium]